MTEQPTDWREGLTPSVADEVQHIRSEFARREAPRDSNEGGADGPISIGVARKGDQIDYLYAEGQILVQDQYLARVLELLGYLTEQELRQQALDRQERPPIRPVIAGAVKLVLQPTSKGEAALPVPEVLATIDQNIGVGVATPDHVLTVSSGEPTFCPATEPEEVYADAVPFPPVCDDDGGGRALVYVADTGLMEHAAEDHSWLAGVRVDDPSVDFETYRPPPPSEINPPPIPAYTGHGTFVAGVLRCMAPTADVVVAKFSLAAGSTVESQLVQRLTAAFGQGADIFHVTLACPSRLDLPLIGFREWLRQLRDYGGAVCIAPAGNSGMRRPSWPAAFADVVSVGALGTDWRGRASYSNFGSWVDVYAPGTDLVNAYTTGTYQCHVSPYADTDRKFFGMARWSGTSFSTPIVSGLIAARISATGEDARTATAAVLAQARAEAVPGVGPVLLPDCRGGRPRSCECSRSSCSCDCARCSCDCARCRR